MSNSHKNILFTIDIFLILSCCINKRQCILFGFDAVDQHKVQQKYKEEGKWNMVSKCLTNTYLKSVVEICVAAKVQLWFITQEFVQAC